MGRRVVVAAVLLVASLGAGCATDAPPAPERTTPAASPSGPATTTTGPPATGPPAGGGTGSGSGASSPSAAPEQDRPATFDQGRAMAHVRHLAGEVGPRLATGPAYQEAAAYVARLLRRWGYDVARQRVPVPAGDSWGVPVGAGTSHNLVATPPGFDPTAPHRLVGAHLDTVAVAPGAEDNASGVGTLLEVARVSADEAGRDALALPTVFVAFGAEEPIGPADDQHHFGSRLHVAALRPAEREALRAVLALDRVGVGSRVPVSATPLGSDPLRDRLLALARQRGVAAFADEDGTTSDHWSYAKAGIAAARLGSTPYAGYHSAGDVVPVVEPDQLGRAGRIALAWLRS